MDHINHPHTRNNIHKLELALFTCVHLMTANWTETCSVWIAGRDEAFEVQILMPRWICTGMVKSARANLEYEVQQDAAVYY
jgi:hypothetical protein